MKLHQRHEREAPAEWHPPLPALRDVVRCLWSLPEGVGPGSILPDGSVNLFFRLGSFGADATLVGTATTAHRASHHPPGAHVLGVCFLPGEASAVLGVGSSDYTDQVANLGDVLGSSAAFLVEQLQRAPSSVSGMRMLQDWLITRLGSASARPDFTLRHVVRAIDRAEGRLRIADLEGSAGLSQRQLERRFLDRVGIGLKLFSRIVRLRATLRAGQLLPRQSWAQLAASYGYSDQAHLIRESAELAGSTPNRIQMSKFFNS